MTVKLEGLDEVTRNLQRQINRIEGPLTERFVTEVLISIAARSATYTPVATSALINSQYRRVKRAQGAWIGDVGYGAEYAAAVNAKPGTLLNTNTPRSPARLGTVWGPNGEPGFMQKGVNEMVKDDLQRIISRNFKL
tara:strand:+ start:1182 stop:1592 length:411 start_codon:yes stop_codon:yes gene_type:complete